MTLDKLTSSQTPGASSPRTLARVPAFLLPVGLLVAFLAVLALLFGSRLLPAREVRVAPVITLRTNAGEAGSASAAPATSPGTQALLFQSSGWVEPDPYIVNVPTLLNGVIKDVHVLEGDTVTKDQLLATLIDDDAKLDVEEATRAIATLDATQVAHCAQLPVLNAEMQATRQRISSQKSLLAEFEDAAQRLASVPRGSVPQLDVEKARLKVEGQKAVIDAANAELAGVLAKITKVDLERLALEAKIRSAQTDLARKQLALDRTQITAPSDGVVLRLHAAPGKKRMLQADDPTSALIVELYDPDKLQARIDVPLTEAAALRIGQPVKLTTDLLPNARFDAKVTRIVGEADLQRNTLQAKVRILDPDPRLRPEMLVRAEFYPGGEASPSRTPGTAPRAGARLAIYAPTAALFDRTDRTGRAWVVDDNRARLRDLKLGSETREDHLLVLEGLRPGDKVILPPHQDLKPDARVEITP